MHILLKTFLVFARIGAFSFGGGYAMLPLIEEEIVHINGFMSKGQFIDILAISQMTPGPIAINSATFVGFMNYGILGSAIATLGVISGPFLYISLIVNRFLDKFKNSPLMKSVLIHIRPVTVALIFCTFISTVKDTPLVIYNIAVFFISFALMESKKLSPFATIALFGLIGVAKKFIV